MSEENEVGYKKPPKHTQFKPGQSGNAKGRPKGSRNFSSDLKATLNERVRVTKGGKAKTVSTQSATLMRLREKALSGDGRALDRVIELARTYNDEEISAATKLGRSDAEILEAYKVQVLRESRLAPPNGDGIARQDGGQDDSTAGKDDLTEEDDDAWLY